MYIYKNAKLTSKGREEMVKRMQKYPVSVVASGFGISTRTAQKWQKRYRQGGISALFNASSASFAAETGFPGGISNASSPCASTA